jgi:hypothetical protein
MQSQLASYILDLYMSSFGKSAVGDAWTQANPFVNRVYVVLAVGVCFPMLMIWFNKPHDIKTFTPAWAFLVSSSLPR